MDSMVIISSSTLALENPWPLKMTLAGSLEAPNRPTLAVRIRKGSTAETS